MATGYKAGRSAPGIVQRVLAAGVDFAEGVVKI